MSTTASQRMLQALPEALETSQHVDVQKTFEKVGSFRGRISREQARGSIVILTSMLSAAANSHNAVDGRCDLPQTTLVGNRSCVSWFKCRSVLV